MDANTLSCWVSPPDEPVGHVSADGACYTKPCHAAIVFGERQLRLGNALPVLAPFLILALRNKPALILLAAAMTGTVVILAGSRGGWISFGLVCVWLFFSETRRRGVPL